MNMKRIIAMSIAVTMAAGIMSGCAKNDGNAETTSAETTVGTSAETAAAEPIKAIFGEIRSEYNTSLDMTERPLTASGVAADFSAKYEAEDGKTEGKAAVENSFDGFSGTGYVDHFEGSTDKLTFTVDAPADGSYDLNFMCASNGGHKVNFVAADGTPIGEITTDNEEFGFNSLKNIYLEKGQHEITLSVSWGWIKVDYLEMTASSAVSEDTYSVSPVLSNPDADENAQRLMKFMTDIYGNYTLSGQFADKGRTSSELARIQEITGKQPAVLGLDLIEYTPSRVANGSSGDAVEQAYDWYVNAGGIVSMCWHWNAPEKYLVNSESNPWYRGFYKEATTINLDDIMNGRDDEGYDLLMQDIDAIAVQLKRLCDSGVPVLWRPLHEASGGWFWWGNCEPGSYKKLWNILYDRLTNEYGLTNLIWVWNGQSSDWYPGDDTVDIIGEDIYPGTQVYTSQSGKFAEAAETSGTAKLVALTENGCVPDPDLLFRDNARWLLWSTWSGEFIVNNFGQLSETYTEADMLKKAYGSEYVLTLDELPDLRNYPIQ